MSQTVHYKGILKRIERLDNEDLESCCKRLCNRDCLPSYYDNYQELLTDEYYNKYVILDHNVYSIEEMNDYEDEDIFELDKISDDKYSFTLKYYNGGCSFDEAIEEAFEKMKKRERRIKN